MNATAPTSAPQAEKRRSLRLMHAMPVTVSGVDALGQPFREHTTTVMVDCYGCKYVSRHYAPKDSIITLEIPNPQKTFSPRIAHGRVVWTQRPRTTREHYQVALALAVPGNVWGITNPPADWFPHPEDEALAVPVSPDSGVLATPAAEEAPVNLTTALSALSDRKGLVSTAEQLVADEMRLLIKRLDAEIRSGVDATAMVLLERITQKAAKDISEQASKHAAAILEEAQKACEETARLLEENIRRLLQEDPATPVAEKKRKAKPASKPRKGSKRKR